VIELSSPQLDWCFNLLVFCAFAFVVVSSASNLFPSLNQYWQGEKSRMREKMQQQILVIYASASGPGDSDSRKEHVLVSFLLDDS
jgi:hypothetical protein